MSPVSAFSAQPREGQIHPSVEVPKQTLLDYLAAFGLASQLTQEEKLQFIEVAQAFRLNPFKREIHVAVYGEGEYRRMSIVVGYQTYLDRAERTGQLDGWRAWVEGQGEDMKAFVEIHRKDWHSPFVHEVYWKECVQRKRDGQPTSFWSKMPRFQLKKVAVSQGFRLAFPSELGGMPYDPAELPDAESIGSQDKPVNTVSLPIMPDQPTMNVTIAADHPKPFTPATKPLPVAEHEPEPEDEITKINRLHDELRSILEDNEDAFTPKHQDWILAKARQASTADGVERMVAYARKVLKNAASMAATA
ncbi:MAG TPA: phage recombination protein Bet [Syntrophobacteraceae bacterium]|jgi:phage recombination protein Bet|nr:phage recombination protein Bet [Syntrophobacteraceae bacterium]